MDIDNGEDAYSEEFEDENSITLSKSDTGFLSRLQLESELDYSSLPVMQMQIPGNGEKEERGGGGEKVIWRKTAKQGTNTDTKKIQTRKKRTKEKGQF